MVDLTLASSYVPAFVCIAKSCLCALLCLYLVPVGGLAALFLVLLMDRVFLNSDFIIDVNAAVSAVGALAVANYERTHSGLHTRATFLVAGLWIALGSVQLARPATLKARTELYCYAALGLCLSFSWHPAEPLPYLLLRTFGYAATVLVQVYWQLATALDEPLVLALLKHAPIMAAPAPVALIAAATPNVIVALRWKPVPPQPQADPDVEAAALREALASRKEKAGN